ncbi:MAG: rhodanese-like domain-containing protein [Arenibacter sp.]|nr:rhodanese-like domain-containing protein [Arenibacter sp.]
MRIAFYCFMLILPLIASCKQEVNGEMPIVEFDQKLLADAILVDVRTPAEFNSGHLENAQNINWSDADFATNFEGVDKDKTIYLYCKVGGRSALAQKKLQAMGYTRVVNLTGGFDAWKNEQLKNPDQQ